MAEQFKINGTDFDCDFTIKSADGTMIKVSKSAIKGLDFEENMFEPFQSATIIIQNAFDMLEDANLVRGDGRDFFSFYVKDSQAQEGDALKYDFVINNEHNSISKTDRSNNFKIYNLIDINYFKLNEPIPHGKRYRGTVDSIIKEILIERIGKDCIGEFEPNDHKVEIFPEYILPPISFRYSDLIKYLLRINFNNVGGTYVKSFLIYDRFSNTYSFVPISKIFAKHLQLLQEGFTTGDLLYENKPNKHNPPPEAKVNKVVASLFNTDFTTPMLTYSNECVMNFMASGYDRIIGEHGIREIRVKEVKQKWRALFVDIFKAVGGAPLPFVPLNSAKKLKLFKTFSLPFDIETNSHIAEAEMTSDMIFYNLQLCINNLGDTKRVPGRFIDIFRQDTERMVDRKILGRWLVTKCRHKFTYDSYQTTLQCVKTYVGPGTKISDSVL